jgi:hypothetical protein
MQSGPAGSLNSKPKELGVVTAAEGGIVGVSGPSSFDVVGESPEERVIELPPVVDGMTKVEIDSTRSSIHLLRHCLHGIN